MNLRILSGLLAVLGLVACASGGNEVLKDQNQATVDLNIVDGRTTRDEVQSLYGSPLHKSFLSEQNEVWTYRWARTTAQGQNFIPIVGAFARGYDRRLKELVVVFNERNVVARHSMTDLNDTVKAGLLDPGAAPARPASSTSLPPTTTAPAIPSASASPAPTLMPTPATAPAASGSDAATPVSGQSRSRL